MGIVVSLLKEAVKTLVGHDIFLFVLNNFRKENLEAAEVRSISSKDMEVRSISSKDMGSQTAMLGSVSFKLGNSKSDTDISDGLKQKDSDASPVGSESNKENNKDAAAVKVQKVYRSYRTRRNLADCAVVAEELWWQAIDFVTLKRNTVSFFDIGKPETAVARWSRAGLKAAKVGKGLSKDENARKLAFQHWMEAIDPRHRYGHNLHFYYDAWFESDTMQPFFYWLDIGDGKGLDLQNLCPRSKLQNHRIKYLGPKEREHYEFIPENGKLVYKQSGQLVDTSNGSEGLKWIFVMSTSKKLYVGQKKKGTFQHSSFLAGGATSAAGRFTVENGILKAIWPHSGHYLPTEQNFTELLNFLEENGIDLSNVEKGTYETASPELERDRSSEKLEGNVQSEAYIEKDDKKNDTAFCDYEQNGSEDKSRDSLTFSQLANENETSNSDDNVQPTISHESSMTEQSTVGTEILKTGEERENQGYLPHNRSVSGELEIEKPEIHHTELLKRFNSKKAIQSYQLGKQLSLKWSSGAGPRIGCVADYPAELRAMALERVNLSPRCASPSSYKLPDCMTPSSNRTPKPTSPSGYKLPKCLTPSSNQSPKGKPPLIIPSPRFKSPLLIPSPMCKSPLLIPSPMCKSPLNPHGDKILDISTQPMSTTHS